MAEVSHRVKEPSFHHTYTRRHTQIDFNRKEKINTCFPFTSSRKENLKPWPKVLKVSTWSSKNKEFRPKEEGAQAAAPSS